MKRTDDGIDIKKLRKRMGLTQAEFAKLLDVEPITIIRWEKGERKPHSVHRRKLERLEKKAKK